MHETAGHRQLAKAFTRPVIEAIARRGDARGVSKELAALLGPQSPEHATVADVFEASFAALRQAYRCEYVYKAAIAQRLVFGRHSPRTAGLAIELPVGNSIVDAAVFNGTSTAYEIKTEFDSSRRLTTQTPDYLKVFDRVYVVTHPSMGPQYASEVDSRVGVLTLSARGSFRELRPAASDTMRLCAATVFRCLRRSEYIDIVQRRFGAQPELPNGLIHDHYQALFASLPLANIHSEFVRALKGRCTDPGLVEFVTKLPDSLRVLGYATPLSQIARRRVLSAIASKVSAR